jgi:hypothetical protein
VRNANSDRNQESQNRKWHWEAKLANGHAFTGGAILPSQEGTVFNTFSLVEEGSFLARGALALDILTSFTHACTFQTKVIRSLDRVGGALLIALTLVREEYPSQIVWVCVVTL